MAPWTFCVELWPAAPLPPVQKRDAHRTFYKTGRAHTDLLQSRQLKACDCQDMRAPTGSLPQCCCRWLEHETTSTCFCKYPPPPTRHKTNTCRKKILNKNACANTYGVCIRPRANAGSHFEEISLKRVFAPLPPPSNVIWM